MHANSSSGFLTLTLNGTLGDLGFLYKPVKFALRSEIATQSTEIIPDERSLNTDRRGLVQHRRHPVEGRAGPQGAGAGTGIAGALEARSLARRSRRPLQRRIEHLQPALGTDQVPVPPDRLAEGPRRLLADVPRAGHVQPLRRIRRLPVGGRFLGAGLLRRRSLCLRLQLDRHDAPPGYRAVRGAWRRLRLRAHLAAGHQLLRHRRLVPDQSRGPRGHRERVRPAAQGMAVRQRRARGFLAAVRGRAQPHHPQRLRRRRTCHRSADQPGQHGTRGRGPARRLLLRIREARPVLGGAVLFEGAEVRVEQLRGR